MYQQRGSNETNLYLTTKKAFWNDTGDYCFSLPQPLTRVRSIQLVSYSIQWSWQNVDSVSNILVLQEGSNLPINIVIPSGDYSDEDLATALTTAMTASSGIGANYTVVSNEITTKMTCHQDSSTHSILLLPGSTISGLINLIKFYIK